MRRASGRAKQTPSLFEAGPAHSAPDASCLSFDTTTPQQSPNPRNLAKTKLSGSCPKKRRATGSGSETAASVDKLMSEVHVSIRVNGVVYLCQSMITQPDWFVSKKAPRSIHIIDED